jgi:hypothetical protein
MKAWLAVWLMVCSSAWAEDASTFITDTVFVPPTSYVGDLVEVRLTLLLPEGKTLLPPLSLPNQPWVLVRDVQVRHEPPFERVTVKYVPFAPGVKVLPPLVLGDVTLDGIRISTNSLLGRDQLLVSHTELFVFLAFFVLIILPLAVWRLVGPLSHFFRDLRRRTDRRQASRQLHRDLKKLQSKVLALSGPEFYQQFSRLVRTYLGNRFGRDFQTLTASEVRGLLVPLPVAWTEEWVRLVHRADVVRFAAEEPPQREKLEDLDLLRREAAHLDSKEAPLVDL